MKNIRLLTISRPRFWIYLAGPFLIGLASGGSWLANEYMLATALLAVYFTFPANLLAYGVNDIFDYETDIQNSKKEQYESLVLPQHRHGLAIAIAITNLPFLVAFIFIPASALPLALIGVLGFAACAIAYSMPPIRAKIRPGFDSVSNVLYALPALAGFALSLSPSTSSADVIHALALPFLAAWMWCAAMHAFSAIPDIAADTSAGIRTIATALGSKKTVLLCAVLYALAGVTAISALGWFSPLFSLVYLSLMYIAWAKLASSSSIFTVYRAFPVVNGLVGMALFFIALFR